jgi:hypothetical protein
MFRRRVIKNGQNLRKDPSNTLNESVDGENDVNLTVLQELKAKQQIRKRFRYEFSESPFNDELSEKPRKLETAPSIENMMSSQFAARPEDVSNSNSRVHEKLMENYVNEKLNQLLR